MSSFVCRGLPHHQVQTITTTADQRGPLQTVALVILNYLVLRPREKLMTVLIITTVRKATMMIITTVRKATTMIVIITVIGTVITMAVTVSTINVQSCQMALPSHLLPHQNLQ